jgi:HAD superfamily hydrolase (TIGR01490 family)
MALALFDLDRTLIGVNSGRLWFEREQELGFLTRWQALRAAAWIGFYHLGFTRLDEVLAEAIAGLEGSLEADIERRTNDFYAATVASTYRPLAAAVVERHRAQGDVVALLTSSSNYLCALVQAKLDIPHALCNRFEVADGRFTGKPAGALCYGAGKLVHARQFAEQVGASLAEAWFYTDSMSDLPVLEEVGHPVAVNPDPRLRRYAQKKGWEIVDWGEVG